jgi:hypothetical protein
MEMEWASPPSSATRSTAGSSVFPVSKALGTPGATNDRADTIFASGTGCTYRYASWSTSSAS